MFGGHDTTISAITFALYNLAKYPDVQQKCAEEAIKVFGTAATDQPATLQLLNQLSYLELAIKESMRLFATIPVIARKVMEDVKLSKQICVFFVQKSSILTNFVVFSYFLCSKWPNGSQRLDRINSVLFDVPQVLVYFNRTKCSNNVIFFFFGIYLSFAAQKISTTPTHLNPNDSRMKNKRKTDSHIRLSHRFRLARGIVQVKNMPCTRWNALFRRFCETSK